MLAFLRKNRNYRIARAKLEEAISLCAPSLEGAGFPGRVEFMNECIRNNEAGVALETLCENLYEFRLPVSQEAMDLVREAGKIMDIECRNWELLESLVVGRAEQTNPEFAEVDAGSDLSDEQIAEDIRKSLRGRTFSDSVDLLREDRNR